MSVESVGGGMKISEIPKNCDQCRGRIEQYIKLNSDTFGFITYQCICWNYSFRTDFVCSELYRVGGN